MGARGGIRDRESRIYVYVFGVRCCEDLGLGVGWCVCFISPIFYSIVLLRSHLPHVFSVFLMSLDSPLAGAD